MEQPGTKWVRIGLSVPFVNLELPVELTEGLCLVKPEELTDSFWLEGLGRWGQEELKEVDFFIESTMHSERANIQDGELADLMRPAQCFKLSLVLTGIKLQHAPLNVYGWRSSDTDRIYRYGKEPSLRFTEGQPYTLLDGSRIDRARQIFVGMKALHEDRTCYARLRKGLYSVFAGLREVSCDDRAYFFTRALEATHAAAKVDGKRRFVERCQAMTGPSAEIEELFGDLYDIRNNVVHVNGFDELVKPGETLAETEARVVERASVAELIAKEIYAKLLSDLDLLRNFSDDDAARAYWCQTPVWSDIVDVQAIRAEREDELFAWHRSR